jgi:hypothetical protein
MIPAIRPSGFDPSRFPDLVLVVGDPDDLSRGLESGQIPPFPVSSVKTLEKEGY